MSQTPNEFLEAQAALADRIKAGSPEPAKSPRMLPWAEIEVIPALFQQRHIDKEVSKQHVQELARAIKAGPRGSHQDHFTPITVLWVGNGWACVDGHHRLEAYRWVDHLQPVPVEVLVGATLGQAVQASLTSNAKTQLELTKRCRTEAAWRLELAGGYSKATVAKLVGVDESSIALMRKALREFKDEHPTADPKAFTWAHMRHWKRGPVEHDGKDATLRRAEQFLRRTEKHLRGVSPEVLLTALDLHCPGMVAELVKVHKTMLERTAYQCLPFGEIVNSAPENPDF